MAKVISNVIVDGLSGGLGRGLMFRRLRDGRTIVCARPDFSKRQLSGQQQDHHQRFREAAAYARTAAKTQPRYAELAAGTMKTAYNIALSDWFHAPLIHAVEVRGGRICISASDNVQVAQVDVQVLDAQGNVLEQGEAVHTGGLWWDYLPGTPPDAWGKFKVQVRDLAGNVTSVSIGWMGDKVG